MATEAGGAIAVGLLKVSPPEPEASAPLLTLVREHDAKQRCSGATPTSAAIVA